MTPCSQAWEPLLLEPFLPGNLRGEEVFYIEGERTRRNLKPPELRADH